MTPWISRSSLFLLVALISSESQAQIDPAPMLRVVVDHSTPRPGGGQIHLSRAFSSVAPDVAISGSAITFRAFDSRDPSSSPGIYSLLGGQLTRLADTTTDVPGGRDTFIELSMPSFTARGVTFWGRDSTGNFFGLYGARAGQIEALVARHTVNPRGFTLTGPGYHATFANRIAFRSSEFTNPGRSGIYLWDDGDVTTVVDSATVAAGNQGPFRTFFDTTLDADSVVFRAGTLGGDHGLYRHSSSSGLEVVADRRTPVPDIPGTNYAWISWSSISNGRIAFVGSYPVGTGNENGIFLWENGTSRRILASTVLEPLTGEPFTSFGPLILVNQRLVMRATTPRSRGIYALSLESPARLLRIAGVGDDIDGVNFFDATFDFDGHNVALVVSSAVNTVSAIAVGRITATSAVPSLGPRALLLMVFALGFAALAAIRRI